MFDPNFSEGLKGIRADKTVGPAIFLKLTNSFNEPFELGGTVQSILYTRAIILADSQYTLDAVGNIFIDKK